MMIFKLLAKFSLDVAINAVLRTYAYMINKFLLLSHVLYRNTIFKLEGKYAICSYKGF